jgi:hypothetical protein
MSSDHGAKPSGQPHQSAGDISVSGQENPLALTNAGGDVAIDQSRQVTIYNYYYREESRTVSVESAEPDNDLPCPYRGLFHFGPNDAEFFFGREVFVIELLEAVETHAFVPVLGASVITTQAYSGLISDSRRLQLGSNTTGNQMRNRAGFPLSFTPNTGNVGPTRLSISWCLQI